jgi:hypothetical protein
MNLGRKGRVLTLTLDRDAVLLLRELSPGKKRLGQTLSELVRAEVGRREERQRWAQEQRVAAGAEVMA